MEIPVLSSKQLRFIQTFGYLHLPGLLADVIERITGGFEELMRDHAGASYAGEHRLMVSPAINRSEALCRAILDDDRIDSVATSLLGREYQYWNSEAMYCGGETPWHSDSPWPAERRFAGWYKLFLYLDPLTRETGALRVIPGSHRCDDRYANEVHYGLTSADDTGFLDAMETWGVDPRALPDVALPSTPGDLIVLDYLTAHASVGGRDGRRLVSAEFFPLLAGADIEQLRRAIRNRGFTRTEVFGPDGPLLGTATERRLRHLQQLWANTPD